MALSTGGLIEIADYNNLALEINRIFSDNTSSLGFTTSNVVLSSTAAAAGEAAGATRTLSPGPVSTDYLVVTVDDVTLSTPTEYTVNYISPVTITFVNPLAPNAVIKVYNRESHRYGWGQQASVYPISSGDKVLADEATLQAYLEANVNNIVDKVNIMETRTTGPTSLSRVSQGALIYSADTTTITSTINSDILAGSNYWKNDVATITSSALTFQRTIDWNNILVGEMRHYWTDYNSFRYFFNSGNNLRATISMTGDPLNQGFNNWSQVATSMGTLILNYDTATNTGSAGTSSNIGAYDLTTSYQTIFTSGSPSAPVDASGYFDVYGNYSALVIKWEAKITENAPAAGNISLDIKVTMNDQSLNVTTSGTTTYTGGYTLADNITDNSAVFSMTAHKPTFSVLNSFTTGDDS